MTKQFLYSGALAGACLMGLSTVAVADQKSRSEDPEVERPSPVAGQPVDERIKERKEDLDFNSREDALYDRHRHHWEHRDTTTGLDYDYKVRDEWNNWRDARESWTESDTYYRASDRHWRDPRFRNRDGDEYWKKSDAYWKDSERFWSKYSEYTGARDRTPGQTTDPADREPFDANEHAHYDRYHHHWEHQHGADADANAAAKAEPWKNRREARQAWRNFDDAWRQNDQEWRKPENRDKDGYEKYWNSSDEYWKDSDRYWDTETHRGPHSDQKKKRNPQDG